jgi:hypothetical protein
MFIKKVLEKVCLLVQSALKTVTVLRKNQCANWTQTPVKVKVESDMSACHLVEDNLKKENLVV